MFPAFKYENMSSSYSFIIVHGIFPAFWRFFGQNKQYDEANLGSFKNEMIFFKTCLAHQIIIVPSLCMSL